MVLGYFISPFISIQLNSIEFYFILLYFNKEYARLNVFLHHGLGLFSFLYLITLFLFKSIHFNSIQINSIRLNQIQFYFISKKQHVKEHCQFWIISDLSVFFHHGLRLLYLTFSFQFNSIKFNSWLSTCGNLSYSLSYKPF